MGKADPFSPKGIANREKAKGLQKLRWYCQMCSKQCRDENGFKCHQTSEAHMRQMRIFLDNPNSIIDEYSQEFEEDFLDTLSRRHGVKRCHANLVYNEFIAYKSHIHMNSTKWETLTDFIKYLGKTGKCVVDETEKGWYVQYIDRDPAVVARQQAEVKKKKSDKDEEQREREALAARVKAAQESAAALGGGDVERPSELKRGGEGEEGDAGAVVKLALTGGLTAKSSLKRPREAKGLSAFGEGGDGEGEDGEGGGSSSSGGGAKGARTEGGGAIGGGGFAMKAGAGSGGKKKSALDALMEADARRKKEEEAKKQQQAQQEQQQQQQAQQEQQQQQQQLQKMGKGDDAGVGNAGNKADGKRSASWLHTGIVVKVLNKKVGGGKYYKQKARVRKVVETFVAEVKMLEGGDKLRVDQDQLETVIPAVGKQVLVVNGRRRGRRAELLALDKDTFSATVRIESDEGSASGGGDGEGEVLTGVEYEDICKLAD